MEIEELPETGTGLRKHSVFAHVLMKNAELYRSILEVFVRSREQFITHLRPAEVAFSIGRDEDETENALRQLRLWGNLEATQDDAEQASLEEFYRVHLLYSLSSPGEAAERALAVFEETMHQPLAEVVTSTGVLRGLDCEVRILYAHEASEMAIFQET
jgi:uncharacterized protein (TIGR02677 family)